MNFFGLLWAVSSLSGILAFQTPLRVLDAFTLFSGKPLPPVTIPFSTAQAESLRRQTTLVANRFLLGSSTPLGIQANSRPVSSSLKHSEFINPALQPSLNSIQSPQTGLPDRILQIVDNLSRWTRGISEALRLATPMVTVVPLKPPRLAIDPSNPLSVLDLDEATPQLKLAPTSLDQFCQSQDVRPLQEMWGAVFQVQVRGKPVAEFPSQEQAEAMADRLRRVFQMSHFDPHQLKPVLIDATPGGKAGDEPLFWVEPELAAQLNRNPELIAIAWINHLRDALNVPTLNLVDAQIQMHNLVPTSEQLEGTASWYGPYFHGRLTATGETFDQTELTAAHPSLPFDTYLTVTNSETGNAVIVRVNDRGPYFENRSLDLSREAARCLGSELTGVVSYEAVIMKRTTGQFDELPTPSSPEPSPEPAPQPTD